MTEEEAKTRWCPMYIQHGDSLNPKTLERGNCIASDCMLWRWDVPVKGHPQDTDKYGHCGLTHP